LIKEIKNADDIVACLKRHQIITNLQRTKLKLSEVQLFIAKMPFHNEPFTHHMYCVVPGISSYYNFCNTGPDFLLKTRIFSDQTKFLHSIESKIETKLYDQSLIEKSDTPLIQKIKNCKFIRRKRLFVDMKERIANDLLTPQSNLFYKKNNPDLSLIPQYCKINKKHACINCNTKCLFSDSYIKDNMTETELKKELKAHFHPQTRKDKTSGEMRQELILHYRFTHQNFGDNYKKKLYCICQEEETENGDCMVLCGMEDKCEEEWFHVSCLQRIDYALPRDLEDIGNLK
jgi:hypothetical protein